MNRFSFACRRLAVVAVLALAVPAYAGTVSGLNNVEPDKGFSNVERAYSGMDEKYVRDGTPRTAQQMRKVRLGQSKNDLVRYAGKPVSANEDGSWNFDIKLPLHDRSRLVCQYRVYFDDHGTVSGTIWRRPQCADIVTGQKN